ncbi:hypothetical protein SPV1_06274 [Mariprofundus ferrooxydans PV-1]|uniref:Uncharacterized protein n=2 Tax=Mariprofundus ferrooxydans TaxID=314344 RepID=Q0EWR6_9PROT|nr:hypothetical protein SPV1_06274 [Mariprofundus ferrooxydans PV-1]
MSLLSFHDAIELFLQLGSEYLGANASNANFLDYWEIISKKLSETELQQKESMRRLNKSRVMLKHHGTLPSKIDIESFRASATSFFEDNTPLVFGIPFSTISLIELVASAEAKHHLKLAETHIEEKRYKEALEQVALSFDVIIRDYENSKSAPFYSSPFEFGHDLTFLDHDFPITDKEEFEGLRRYMKVLTDTLGDMQSAMKIFALGIDYRRYGRFKYYVPQVNRAAAGNYQIVWTQRQRSFSFEEVQFCFDFVIQSALLLSEFDYDAPVIEMSIPDTIPSFK